VEHYRVKIGAFDNFQVPSETNMEITRRSFAGLTVATMAGLHAKRLNAQAQSRPSNRINLGVIGLGSRGFNLLNDFAQLPNCQIVAICDVDDYHYRDRPWGKGMAWGRQPAKQFIQKAYASQKSGTAFSGLRVYSDYRELIAGKDLDAVVIATPDHWHALCTFESLQAGKDVYCEKPLTHLFSEGQAIVRETAQRNAVFQTGSQQRSDPLFHKIVELTQNGVLGEIQSVEVGLPPGYEKPQGSTKVMPPRKELDYNFWCGPAPALPLMQARHHRWWRGHRAYGGGVLMDWIGHHNDIAHWALGLERSGPTTVEAIDWEFPETDIYNTPSQYTIRCEYHGGVISTISSRHKTGLKIIGSDGWVYARRGKLEASDPRWLQKTFRAGPFRIPQPVSHAANFLNCVSNRTECTAPPEIAHRSITPGHLGYVSFALNRSLTWDSAKEIVTNDDAANKLLTAIEYRTPWQVPGS